MHHHLRVTYENRSGRTSATHRFETGSLRLRHPRGATCEALAVNTGGGLVAGDAVSIAVVLQRGAEVTVSSASAEKIYRSDGAASTVGTALAAAAATRLAWLPQETILFDGARLHRRFTVDVAADATFLACETMQFGRPAYGEHATHGSLQDSWRIRRDGRLIHAEESRIEGAIGDVLDRPATAGGARAVAQLLFTAPQVAGCGERLEAVLAPFRSRDPFLDGGVSAKDGIVLARLLARSASDLRPCIAAMIETCPGFHLPSAWR